MENLLTYLSTPAPREESLATRSLRAVSALGSLWLLAGVLLSFWTMDAHSRVLQRLHALGSGCYLVGAAILSVALTLQAVLKRHNEDR